MVRGEVSSQVKSGLLQVKSDQNIVNTSNKIPMDSNAAPLVIFLSLDNTNTLAHKCNFEIRELTWMRISICQYSIPLS